MNVEQGIPNDGIKRECLYRQTIPPNIIKPQADLEERLIDGQIFFQNLFQVFYQEGFS